MKNALIIAAAAASIASAKPHGHAHIHRHEHKREPAAVTVSAPVAVTWDFVFPDGKAVDRASVCQGIQDGSLKFDGEAPAGICDSVSSVTPSSAAQPTTAPAPTSSSGPAAAQFYPKASSSAPVVSSSSLSSSSSSSVAASSSSAPAAKSSQVASTGNIDFSNVQMFTSKLAQSSYQDFPDGQIDCSTSVAQLSQYGPIPVNYLGMNGWVSLQNLGAGNIEVSAASACGPNVACGYSCPPGMQPLQWPSEQPGNGQAIGGLMCQNGKLVRPNTGSPLCGGGVGGVSVQNSASNRFAVCRTSYPGSEAEVIPMDVMPGATEPLACPNAQTFYQHMGQPTSAQYYLNEIGVAASVACSWNGNGDGMTGNAAPINFGVGQSNGVWFLSMFQDLPTTCRLFQGSVKLSTSDGKSTCSYSPSTGYCMNGQCTMPDCNDTSKSAGCTISFSQGVTATYTVSD